MVMPRKKGITIKCNHDLGRYSVIPNVCSLHGRDECPTRQADANNVRVYERKLEESYSNVCVLCIERRAIFIALLRDDTIAQIIIFLLNYDDLLRKVWIWIFMCIYAI